VSIVLLERCRSEHVSLAERTSMRVGGRAREFFLPNSAEELGEICRRLFAEGKDPFFLGGGFNTLFPDGEYSRPVISTERLVGLSRPAENRIRAEAGVRWNVLIHKSIQAGLAGLEYFAGVPGTAGGLAAMNAGGSGRSFGDRIVRVEGFRLPEVEFLEIPGDRIPWGYRSSGLGRFAITAVELELTPSDPSTIRRGAMDFLRYKASVQPLTIPSSGCIFRNPPGESAGTLIERAGLKGARRGGAVVSRLHANFIVNENSEATASDVYALIEHVERRVRERFGVQLETEVILPENV